MYIYIYIYVYATGGAVALSQLITRNVQAFVLKSVRGAPHQNDAKMIALSP